MPYAIRSYPNTKGKRMEKPRLQQIVIRVHAKEKAALKKAAKRMGVHLSTAVRDMSLVGADMINTKEVTK